MPTVSTIISTTRLHGWIQNDGDWEWKEDGLVTSEVMVEGDERGGDVSGGDVSRGDEQIGDTNTNTKTNIVPPKLPSGTFKPKQSLGQNFLTDSNTITRIINSFHSDATQGISESGGVGGMVELGPGPGALTQVLIERYGTEDFSCIEIDQRAVQVLNER